MKTFSLVLLVLIIGLSSSVAHADGVDSSAIYYKKGMTELKAYNYKEAIVFFDSVIKFKPDMSSAYYYRAICKCNSDLKAEGCLDLKKASELGHYVEKVATSCDCDAKDPKPKVE